MTQLDKHPVYKLNTDEVDFSNFRVLLVYANSPMDNLFPVGLSSIGGMLKKHKINYNIFDTTYYPNDGRLGVNKSASKSRDENLIDRLQVAEFDYREVGIEYIETNGLDIQTILMEEFDNQTTDKIMNIQDIINDLLLGDHYRVFLRN